MLRNALYEAGDNPLQPQLLPKDQRPTIQVAGSALSPTELRREALLRLRRLWLVGAAAVLAATLADRHYDTLMFVIPLAALLCWRAPKVDPTLAGFLGAAIIIGVWGVPHCCPITLAVVAPAVVARLFALHFVCQFSAWPVSTNTSARIRDQFRRSLAGEVGSLWFVPLALRCLFLSPTSWALVPGAFVQAVRGFLTYDLELVPSAHAVISSAGDARKRFECASLAVALLAFGLVYYARYGIGSPETFGVLPPAPWLGPMSSLVPPELLEHYPLLTTAVLVAVWLSSPVLVLMLYCVIATAPAIAVVIPARREAHAGTPAEQHARIVSEIHQSADSIEQDSIYVGRVVADGTPLLVPRKIYGHHAWLLGGTGGGKTTFLTQLAEQLIAKGNCSLRCVDLKADTSEFPEAAAAAAATAARTKSIHIPVKHFTPQLNQSSYVFQMFQDPRWVGLTIHQRADILCGVLGLIHGTDYGRGHYTAINAMLVAETLKRRPDARSFKDLADEVERIMTRGKKGDVLPEIRKSGVQVLSALQRLGDIEPLNATASNTPARAFADRIDSTSLFTQPEVQYFSLSSSISPGLSPEIGRLAAFSLLLGAPPLLERRCQVYLLIDEFQRILSGNLEYFLQTARSMGIGVIVANQAAEDLRSRGVNLVDTLESNTAYRQWFRVTSVADQQRLIKLSGEQMQTRTSVTVGESANGTAKTSVTMNEVVAPRLTTTEINKIGADTNRSIVQITMNEGYAAYGGMPFVVEGSYHIDKEEYERRKTAPWPAATESTIVATGHIAHAQAAPPQHPIVTTESINSPASDSTNPDFSFLDLLGNPPEPPAGRKRRRKPKQ